MKWPPAWELVVTDNWKEDAIQRGLEHGSREITIVGVITRQLLGRTLQAGKDLVCGSSDL
jgi:hypothetical protein